MDELKKKPTYDLAVVHGNYQKTKISIMRFFIMIFALTLLSTSMKAQTRNDSLTLIELHWKMVALGNQDKNIPLPVDQQKDMNFKPDGTVVLPDYKTSHQMTWTFDSPTRSIVLDDPYAIQTLNSKEFIIVDQKLGTKIIMKRA